MKTLLPILLLAASTVGAATVDGIPIHFSSTGKGPKTVILVHGWTCDETAWSEQVPALAGQYRVVTLDLPGHGKSGCPRMESSPWTCSPAPSKPFEPRSKRTVWCWRGTAWALL